MKMKFNIYLFEYAISSLLREKAKNIFIFIVLTLVIFLLSSVFFISHSLKYELDLTLNELPQITVQKIKAGRSYEIESERLNEIMDINGVENAYGRIWGYYFFKNGGVNFTLIGIDEFDENYKNSLEKISENFNDRLFDSSASMVVGVGVKRVMQENYYEKYFNFIKPNGELKKVYIAGEFNSISELESNDVIVMSNDNIREVFDLKNDTFTDIVVKVANPKEIATVVGKIQQLYPDTRVISKNDLSVSYQNIFDYKSGVFLALFLVSLFTFFIIIYDKLSGLSSERKKEIGVLKAIGWSVNDVLKAKFYEGFILSFFAYIVGVSIALFFVFILNAPLLRFIFEGYSVLKTSFSLVFVLDMQTLFLVFFLSVPIFIAATIIPSWKIATLDADEVMR